MKTTNRFKQGQAVKKIMSIILIAVILMSTPFEAVPAAVNATQDTVNNVLDDAASDSTAERSDKIAEQSDKIAERSDKIAEQSDKIAEQSDSTAGQSDQLAGQSDKIAGLAYIHENYEIIYTVKSEWQNHQTIEVILKNIGETSIKNWAVSVETSGRVTGLWNAVLLTADENDGDIVLKNAGWNSVIQPGQSVTFGYTLEGENLSFPAEISLCPVTEKEQETAEAKLLITGDWGVGFTGEIHIYNHSENAVSGWRLTFDGNFEINNLWNGQLVSSEDGTYTVSHTAWQNEIPAGGEHVVGFTGTKTAEEPQVRDCIVYGIEEYGKTGDVSGNDKPSVGDGTEGETKPEEPVNWEDDTDTDNDGIPDVYEKYMFGSSPENADSDGDGLPDGWEVLFLGTSPVLADSNEDGISDGDSDEDGDGLTNMQEYLLGTNPLAKDTDYDGLEDKEELEKYGTDPLNADTDSDGISDGDEVKLGLEPLNPATNGTPDSLYCIPQEIGTDSAVLKSVNETAGNPYEVSLSIQASGVAEHNIFVDGTSYGTVFDSGAAVGSPLFIEYHDDMSLETLRITYHVDEEIHENELDLFGDDTTELHGIRRLNVFWFDETINMLLPVETFHDEENGLVYADMDKDGVFCLMDMEKWIYGLAEETGIFEAEGMAYALDDEGIYPEYVSGGMEREYETGGTGETAFDEEELMERISALYSAVENSADTPAAFSTGSRRKAIKKTAQVDFVVILQTEGTHAKGIRSAEQRKEYIFAVYNTIYINEFNPDLRISILEEKADGTYSRAGKNRAYWYENAAYDRDTEWKYSSKTVDRSALEFVLGDEMGFREDSVKFVAYIPSGKTSTGMEQFEEYAVRMAERGICYSEIHDNSTPYGEYTDDVRGFVRRAGGELFFTTNSTWWETTAEWYFNRVKNPFRPTDKPQTEFKGITATGYRTIILEQPLSSASGYDSDGDGLTDWEEVNTELLIWNRDGSITLPTLLYCVENYSEDSYVIAGLERFKKDITQHGVPSNIYEDYIRHVMRNTSILPIHSHPRRVDTDGDGILDFYNGRFPSEYHFADPNPLKVDIRETALKNDFFSVDYEYKEDAEKNWAEKKNGGRAASYGGNQGWFDEYGILGESKVFCNGSATGNDIENYGCGIIAVADMFLYMALGDSRYNPTCNPPYDPGFGYDLTPALELGNSFEHLDFDTYIQYISMVSNDFWMENIAGNIGVPAFGPFRATLSDGVYNICERNHMGLEGNWAPAFNSRKCLEIMKEMFENDIPVMFSYFTFDDDNNSKLLYKRFDIKDGKILNGKSVASHYMTATGIAEYSEDVKEILGFERAIKVATWGEKFYMNYDDIGNHLDFFTNIYKLYRVGE